MRYIIIISLLSVFTVHAATMCEVNGCNGELCTLKDESVFSTCLWKAEYQCYKEYGVCETDENGKCGWRQSEELLECISQAQQLVQRGDLFSD